MIITGLSHGFHDAAIAKIDSDGNIIYAAHSERLSRVKNDPELAFEFVAEGTTVFYEKPFLKNLRRLYAGQSWKSRPVYDHYISHHWSHAAAAYYTRPHSEVEPVCVVIDAIGEWDTCSIWYNKKKVWSKKYPFSLGLMYSALTKAVGLKPNEDEYITMGMAAYGEPRFDLSYILDLDLHRGLPNDFLRGARKEDVAASAQKLVEDQILEIMEIARKYSSYLCYGGGVALNCVANTKVSKMFDKMWIMPNPGDAGSSLGAAAAHLDKPLNWQGPYLGTEISRQINPKRVAKYLLNNKICGVANGRAEFGPRALGNRSLLADPRQSIHDTVNDIKQRQRYRPFAPAILEEFADQYFEGPMNQYMQYVAKSKHSYRSVMHVDGSARVQLVTPTCNTILRPILEEWYELTKCPMLLNTSLNIKGQPMVDNEQDAIEWSKRYNVKVF